MVANPTVKQRRLARKLKEARLAAGMTHDQAAEALDCKQPKISKIENAQVSVNSDDVRTLAETYRLPSDRVEALTRLARQAKKPGWWHLYADSLATDGEDFLEIETDAVRASNFEADVIPGLLQTESYARAVIRAFDPEVNDDTVDKRTEIRMKRQRRVLEGDLRLWAVVDTGALERIVGGIEVQRAQLWQLVEAIQHPTVTFQVLPPEAGEHMAMSTPFNCFTFSVGGGAVAIDHLTGTFCVEDQVVVERYTLAFDHLRATALSPRDSLAWVRRVAERMS
jgi:transcriptional regulator with XRE-family HTH domain